VDQHDGSAAAAAVFNVEVHGLSFGLCRSTGQRFRCGHGTSCCATKYACDSTQAGANHHTHRATHCDADGSASGCACHHAATGQG
jgi:hypothetical protein